MSPTFVSGQKLLMKTFHNEDLQKNDIVVFEKGGVTNIKRVLGIEGDHIVINNNLITINGAEYYELKCYEECKNMDVIIPEEKYFLVGDNRKISYDSRYYGLVDEDNINLVNKKY